MNHNERKQRIHAQWHTAQRIARQWNNAANRRKAGDLAHIVRILESL